jgi:K+-sensing histidine kinase KdpD
LAIGIKGALRTSAVRLAGVDAGGVTNTTLDHDPVIDFILGRDGTRLSFAAGAGITFLSCLVLAAVVASGFIGGTFAFAGFVVIVAVLSWWSSPATAVVLALVGFLFANGFVLDTSGTLAWHGETDLLRLVCLLGLALTLSVLGHGRIDRPRRRRELDPAASRVREWPTQQSVNNP